MICLHKAIIAGAAIIVLVFAGWVYLGRSETVQVKYRGEVSLASFDCTNITRSSFVRRICYDRSNSYMLINLNGTYYHYCEIDGETIAGLLRAEFARQIF